LQKTKQKQYVIFLKRNRYCQHFEQKSNFLAGIIQNQVLY